LPVYFCGHTNVGFQLLSMIHPRLRAAFLMQEFLQQEGKTVEVRVGTPIDHSSITGIAGDREATEYLRWRTYLLARRHPSAAKPAKRLRPKLLGRMEEPLAAALSNSSLAEELIRLTPDRCLAESGNLAVYLTSATEIPCLLREVGRLRELTFRHVGEGTGKSFDLDRFDEYYWHLLLWDRMRRELVGAYRAGSFSRFTASAASTPVRSSAMTNVSSTGSGLRGSWAVRLYVSNTSANTLLCCFYGKVSHAWWPGGRISRCCSAP